MTYDIYISAHQFYHVFFLRGVGELAYSLRRGLFKKMKCLICLKREGDLDNYRESGGRVNDSYVESKLLERKKKQLNLG